MVQLLIFHQQDTSQQVSAVPLLKFLLLKMKTWMFKYTRPTIHLIHSKRFLLLNFPILPSVYSCFLRILPVRYAGFYIKFRLQI